MSNNRQELLNNGAAVGPQGEGMDSPSRFPRYPAYRCSGVEWLGEMPEHWEVTKLSYVTSRIGSGKTPSGGAATYASSGVPFIRSQNVHDEGLRLDDIVYIDEETDREMAWSRVRPLDVLINITGASIGRSCQVPAKFGRANVNQHVCVIRLNKAVESSDWVAWFMKSPSSKEQVKVSQTGAAREGLNFEQLAGFYLCMPPLNERNVIAAFLDHETARIDALIAEQQRLIELLKEKRQAVISHVVTKGLDPTVPMKDSGVEWLGEVPAHWALVPFGLAFEYQEGPGIMAVDFRDEGVPLVRISGVQGRLVTLEGCKYLEPSKVKQKWAHFRLDKGDLIISGSASIGLVGEVGEDAAGAVAYTGLIRLKPRVNVSIRDFIRSIVGSYQFHAQIDLLKAGSTIQHFGPTHLSQMKVMLPPVNEQAQIAAYVDTISVQFDELLGEAENANALLQERRSALISAAVTGKIDVRGWQPPAESAASITHNIQ